MARFATVSFLALVASWSPSGTAAERLQFNGDVRPILVDKCFPCHGPDSAARQADLRLDQRAVAIDAGAIAPGAPDDSELIARIFSDDADGAIGVMESRGAAVDLWQDAMIHGPEEVWYQIDSRARPFPVGHPANKTGETLLSYHNR